MRTLVFLSGKGGVGKTSISLTIGRILGEMSQKVLIVDADLGTNGASFFLKIPDGVKGLNQLGSLDDIDKYWIVKNEGQEKIVFEAVGGDHVHYRFDFIASNPKSLEEFENPEPQKIGVIFEAVHYYAVTKEYDYLLLDCQSGINTYTETIFDVLTADERKKDLHVVIVMEQDAICINSTLRLVEKLARRLRRIEVNYLANKLFLKETKSYNSYNKIRDEASNIPHLPAIPFDFDVRESFALGEIPPFEAKNPSAYAFGVLRVFRRLFPELKDDIDKMELAFKDSYQNRLNKMKSQREDITTDIRKIHIGMSTYPVRILLSALVMPLAILSLIGLALLSREFISLPELLNPITLLGVATALFLLSTPVIYYTYQQFQRDMEADQIDLDNKKEELLEVNSRIETYTILDVTEPPSTTLSD